jgi:2',3'-cyclic-nucleotide 2'-phosphodiesterase
MLKILFFGDVIGKIGRKALIKALPEIKKKFKPDLTVANAENLAHGIGVTPKTLKEVMDAGVDFFTSGNHVFQKPEVVKIFEWEFSPLIRPANYLSPKPGEGEKVLIVGEFSVLMINLMGRVFIEEEFSCPFKRADDILNSYDTSSFSAVIVDFHAEATSEKSALAHFLDGRVSAVIGTHTHVPTADEKILEKGTAFISDVGMVGLKDSVIGDKKEPIIQSFVNGDPIKIEIPETGEVSINAVFLRINPETRKAESIKRFHHEALIK